MTHAFQLVGHDEAGAFAGFLHHLPGSVAAVAGEQPAADKQADEDGADDDRQKMVQGAGRHFAAGLLDRLAEHGAPGPFLTPMGEYYQGREY